MEVVPLTRECRAVSAEWLGLCSILVRHSEQGYLYRQQNARQMRPLQFVQRERQAVAADKMVVTASPALLLSFGYAIELSFSGLSANA